MTAAWRVIHDSLDTDLHTRAQLIFDKSVGAMQRRGVAFSANAATTTGHPQARHRLQPASHTLHRKLKMET